MNYEVFCKNSDILSVANEFLPDWLHGNFSEFPYGFYFWVSGSIIIANRAYACLKPKDYAKF